MVGVDGPPRVWPTTLHSFSNYNMLNVSWEGKVPDWSCTVICLVKFSSLSSGKDDSYHGHARNRYSKGPLSGSQQWTRCTLCHCTWIYTFWSWSWSWKDGSVSAMKGKWDKRTSAILAAGWLGCQRNRLTAERSQARFMLLTDCPQLTHLVSCFMRIRITSMWRFNTRTPSKKQLFSCLMFIWTTGRCLKMDSRNCEFILKGRTCI